MVDLGRFLDRFAEFWATPHRRYVASLLRVGLGMMTLLFFAGHYREHAFILGPNGMIDFGWYVRTAAPSEIFSLYGLNSAPWWSEMLYALSILCSITFMFGILPRLSAIALFILVTAAFGRNWEVLDGGHNILVLVLFYLCFADLRVNALYAPDFLAWLTRGLGAARTPILNARDYLRTLLHNGAMTLVVGQVAIIYFFSAFYKITGHKWQDGTAVYYVMRTDEFAFPPFSEAIYLSALLVTVLTLSTLVFQMSFPFLMWNRRAKPFLFAGAVMLHSGIAVFMGLVLFSMTMIVADLAVFDDTAVLAAEAWLRRLFRGATRAEKPPSLVPASG